MSETNIEGILAFCSNVKNEARKGYYNDDADYILGYEDAINDVLSYIDGNVIK